MLIGYRQSIYNKPFEEGYELFEQRVKAHYGGQNMFSQQLFSEIVWLLISTKPTLKEVFTNYTQNKVVQLPNNTIVKRNYIFYWY
jgi:hypothetical protein